MKKTPSSLISLCKSARNESGYHLDLVAREIDLERGFSPMESDIDLRERIMDAISSAYTEAVFKAEPVSNHLTGSNPQFTVFDEPQHAGGFAEIKDRLDKLGEKVDQASASLKDLIQAQLRPAQEPVNMWRDIKIHAAGTPPEGTSHIDYFREQFMTAPIKASRTAPIKSSGFRIEEHSFDRSNFQDFTQVTQVTSECLQAQRAEMQMSRIVERSKRRQAAQVYVHQLFSGIDGDAVINQVERDFGKGSATASDEEYSLILTSIYNLLMKRAQDKAGHDE